MSTTLEIPFSKLHGLGNDWIVVDAAELRKSVPERRWAHFACAILEPHMGVGADGLILVLNSGAEARPAEIRFFNADGSEAEMSGNGIRCAGAYLLHKSRKNARPRRRAVGTPASRTLRIETAAGLKTLEVLTAGPNAWAFRVAMGAPIFEPSRIPFSGSEGAEAMVKFPLKLEGKTFPITVSSMGNPHCTVFLEDLRAQSFDDLDWKALGRKIERHPMFPNRTNVEFVRIISSSQIEVRFWERGVGPTQSSGTGSCGATVASILNGLTRRKVRVRTLAGSLDVYWAKGGEVLLTGPAALIAEGVYRSRIQLAGGRPGKRR